MAKTKSTRAPHQSSSSGFARKRKTIRSCAACHERKVSCDQERPSCSACRRHARTLGQDVDSVVCHYAVPATKPLHVEVRGELALPRSDSNDSLSHEPVAKRLKRGRGRPKKRAITPPDSEEDFEEDEEEVAEQDDSDDYDPELVGMGLRKDPRRRSVPNVKLGEMLIETQTRAPPAPTTNLQLPSPISSPIDFKIPIFHEQAEASADLSRSPSPSLSPSPSPPFYTSLFSGSQPFSLTSPPLLATPLDDSSLYTNYGWTSNMYSYFNDPPLVSSYGYSVPTPLGKHPSSSVFGGFDLDGFDDLPSW